MGDAVVEAALTAAAPLALLDGFAAVLTVDGRGHVHVPSKVRRRPQSAQISHARHRATTRWRQGTSESASDVMVGAGLAYRSVAAQFVAAGRAVPVVVVSVRLPTHPVIGRRFEVGGFD